LGRRRCAARHPRPESSRAGRPGYGCVSWWLSTHACELMSLDIIRSQATLIHLLQDISVLVVEQGGSSNHWAIWAWSIVFGGRQSTPLDDRMSATATPHALVHLLDGKHAWAVISRGCTHLGSRRRRTTSSRTSTGQRKVFTVHGKVNAVAVLQSLDSRPSPAVLVLSIFSYPSMLLALSPPLHAHLCVHQFTSQKRAAHRAGSRRHAR
jgi:hypothetical protein